jgi:hypothetical protein
MEKLYRQLLKIQKKPEMYFGKKSIILLSSYLNGFLDFQSREPSNFKCSFYRFDSFVKNYYKSKAEEWVDMILEKYDDENGFDAFYKLLILFLNEN